MRVGTGESESSSTRIEGLSQEELVDQCNAAVAGGRTLVPGYAPFCTHLFLENKSTTRCAFAVITEQNRHLLQSGYRARREGELAVLERWFEGFEAPVAGYLDVILYSHAQLLKEAADFPEEEADVPDCDWGIVSIIGTLTPTEPPMPPITQLRNALGRQRRRFRRADRCDKICRRGRLLGSACPGKIVFISQCAANTIDRFYASRLVSTAGTPSIGDASRRQPSEN